MAYELAVLEEGNYQTLPNRFLDHITIYVEGFAFALTIQVAINRVLDVVGSGTHATTLPTIRVYCRLLDRVTTFRVARDSGNNLYAA